MYIQLVPVRKVLPARRCAFVQGGGGGPAATAKEHDQGQLSAIEQFQAQKEAARKRTNALGQTETGLPMWKVRLRLRTATPSSSCPPFHHCRKHRTFVAR
jgi:hypothetical protein